jgi:hypothetical protein
LGHKNGERSRIGGRLPSKSHVQILVDRGIIQSEWMNEFTSVSTHHFSATDRGHETIAPLKNALTAKQGCRWASQFMEFQ